MQKTYNSDMLRRTSPITLFEKREMETAKKKRLLQCIKNVYDAAKENKLDSVLFEKIDGELKELSRYFEVSKMQAFFLANYFVMNYKTEPEDIITLFKHDLSAFGKLMKQFEIIYLNPIRMKHISKDRYMIEFRKNKFAITEELRNQFSIICQCRNCKK
jgi:hypothetical protein